MMSANRDIDVEERANIPNFSALDDLVTPLRLLKLFFVTFQLIWFLATSSCTVEKVGINFEITNDKTWLTLSMSLLTGYHKLPDHKMYWEMTPIVLCQQGLIQCLVIRSRGFFRIFIFVVKNNLINKTNSRSSLQWLKSQKKVFLIFPKSLMALSRPQLGYLFYLEVFLTVLQNCSIKAFVNLRLTPLKFQKVKQQQ